MKPSRLVIVGLVVLGLVAFGGDESLATFTTTISNVAPRVDVNGNIVDAHDGCVQKFGDRYYLYGAAYGDTDGFGTTNHYQCYSSPDMVTWRLEGDMLQNAPTGVYYRPYVVYNAKTEKYVAWYNWYSTLWDGQFGVATSDTPNGPFTIQNTNVSVARSQTGDLNLMVDDDGAGYLIYTSALTASTGDHAISIERLSDDYLSSTQQNSGVLATGCEAPSLFKRGDTYYALFDSCCCFGPAGTGARVYTASSPLGTYTYRNNINRDAGGTPIIAAQQTYVAQIPTENGTMYMWMGDRWGSRPDGIKGHDFQYWAPLEFDSAGNIAALQWTDQFEVTLTPEPTVAALALSGLLVVAVRVLQIRRRRKA